MNEYYIELQKRLNLKHKEIHDEHEAFTSEREQIREYCRLSSEVLHLNIGGTHKIMCDKELLQSEKNSNLARLFNEL